jgi:hypothetical protein
LLLKHQNYIILSNFNFRYAFLRKKLWDMQKNCCMKDFLFAHFSCFHQSWDFEVFNNKSFDHWFSMLFQSLNYSFAWIKNKFFSLFHYPWKFKRYNISFQFLRKINSEIKTRWIWKLFYLQIVTNEYYFEMKV